ncbi:hypothetical protein COCCADRAFT_113458 [Bipolaris zeicola 26-R-13]|uniref:Uncharacterized protein n=1 Tax=Cochliobolus carbonum (strain 26-R-13) TaxID=930089 RepID=W6XVF2_COCC2|nr:uncharacterized protein COCCADRAFT_113458 [Bipolaris zeicola 26-R-13]EUC26759.1 hypothetical protein COCCADRAFT_113458 [Bipolaris zeicola 26-R-13]
MYQKLVLVRLVLSLLYTAWYHILTWTWMSYSIGRIQCNSMKHLYSEPAGWYLTPPKINKAFLIFLRHRVNERDTPAQNTKSQQ